MSRETDQQTQDRIKRLKEQTPMSQREIAAVVRVSLPTVQKILRNSA